MGRITGFSTVKNRIYAKQKQDQLKSFNLCDNLILHSLFSLIPLYSAFFQLSIHFLMTNTFSAAIFLSYLSIDFSSVFGNLTCVSV